MIIQLENGYPHLIHSYSAAIIKTETFNLQNATFMPLILFYNSTYSNSRSIIYDPAVFDEFITVKFVQYKRKDGVMMPVENFGIRNCTLDDFKDVQNKIKVDHFFKDNIPFCPHK